MDLAILDPATMPDLMKERAPRTTFTVISGHEPSLIPRRIIGRFRPWIPLIGYRFGYKNDRQNDHERYHERDYDSSL